MLVAVWPSIPSFIYDFAAGPISVPTSPSGLARDRYGLSDLADAGPNLIDGLAFLRGLRSGFSRSTGQYSTRTLAENVRFSAAGQAGQWGTILMAF